MADQSKPDIKPEDLPWLGRKLLWLDNMKNVDRIVYGLYAFCALLIALDLLYYKKVYFSLEKLTGFYGLYGFVMCAALVICARGMRIFLMRPEEYYAPSDVESETHPEADLDREAHDA